MSSKKKMSFADLGLKTAMPAVMTTTKEQRKNSKVLEKRAKNERFKAAMTELAASKEKIDKHQEFLVEEKEKEDAEKKIRKLEQKREHMKARGKRDAEDSRKDKAFVVHQQKVMKHIRESLDTRRVEEEAMRALIETQIEAASKEAPKPVNIIVNRTRAIQETRHSLPVMAKEHDFMEAVYDKRNHCVLVCGDTGSGKTTQIPQFLWEAGFGHKKEGTPVQRQGIIGVTEPRRVAATSMARRIAEELNEPFGGSVCFQVRYHNNLPKDPAQIKMKVMTEGILLRELESDFLLTKYSSIVIDEAHERSVSCDLLIGLLSRIVPLRQALHDEELENHRVKEAAKRNAAIADAEDDEGGDSDEDGIPDVIAVATTPPVVKITPLKLIIMSATLRVDDFRANTKLFPRQPPLIQVEGRRFPVHVHFAKKTSLDKYVDEAFKKARQIHKKLPPGGILIFLSTQREIDDLVQRLKDHYKKTKIVYDEKSYNKHQQLKSRQIAAKKALNDVTTAAQEASSSSVASPGGDDAPKLVDEDQYGLKNEDYALEGDEDYPEGEGPGAEANARGGNSVGELLGLKDDFDYGAVRDVPQISGNKRNNKQKASTAMSEEVKPLVKKARVEKSSAGTAGVFGADIGFDDVEEDEEEDTEAAPELSEAEYLDPNFAGGQEADQSEGEDDDDDDGFDEPQKEEPEKEEEDAGEFDTLHVLPLYSLLNPSEQARVFEDVPPGKRLLVVATNIAETSITIPNIRYVIDAGRVKTKTLHPETGVQVFSVRWTSQAATEQRSGRAGRTAPGHCYRLFSTAVFANHMPKHPDPEILRTPLESVVLMMKHMKIDHVGNFPYATAPSTEAIAQALRHLCLIGALDWKSKRCTSLGSSLSSFPVAPRFARMIVAAHSSEKFVVDLLGPATNGTASQKRSRQRVIDAILLAAAITSTTMDTFGSHRAGAHNENQQKLVDAGSDYVTWARALMEYGAAVHHQETRNHKKKHGDYGSPLERHSSPFDVCQSLGMTYKSIKEAWQLVRQLQRQCALAGLPNFSTIPAATPKGKQAAPTPALDDFEFHEGLDEGVDPAAATTTSEEGAGEKEKKGGPLMTSVNRSLPATLTDGFVVGFNKAEEAAAFRKIVGVGLIDHVARRATSIECRQQNLLYSDAKTSKVPYFDYTTGDIMLIHPSSSCIKTSPPPQYLIYTSLQRVKRGPEGTAKDANENSGQKMEIRTRGFGKNTKQQLQVQLEKPSIFMRGVTCVTRSWLEDFGWSEDVMDVIRSSGILPEI